MSNDKDKKFVIGIAGSKDIQCNDDIRMEFTRSRISYAHSLIERLPKFDCEIVIVNILPLYQMIKSYVHFLDGIIFTGGDNSIHPKLYGSSLHGVKESEEFIDYTGRVEFDLAMMEAFLDVKKPMLCICLGLEIMNVLFGGNLKRIDEDNTIQHYYYRNYRDAMNLRHKILWKEGIDGNPLFTELDLRHKECIVNSAHSYCIDKIGDGVVDVAHSEDGLIEAAFYQNHPFMVGVQWHPELLSNSVDKEEGSGGQIDVIDKFLTAVCCK